jgi:hypothetical protein
MISEAFLTLQGVTGRHALPAPGRSPWPRRRDGGPGRVSRRRPNSAIHRKARKRGPLSPRAMPAAMHVASRAKHLLWSLAPVFHRGPADDFVRVSLCLRRAAMSYALVIVIMAWLGNARSICREQITGHCSLAACASGASCSQDTRRSRPEGPGEPRDRRISPHRIAPSAQ